MEHQGWIFGIIFPVAMALIGVAAATGRARDGEIAYSRALHVVFVALGVVPLALIAALVIAKPPRGDDWLWIALLVAMFGLMTTPLWLETLRVRHRYDDEGIDYRSPWTRHRRVAWSSVVSVRWRGVMKWFDLETESGDVLHVSPLQVGLEGFARMAKARLPASVLVAAPADAKAVVELMERGLAAQLLMSPVPPTMLLASLA